MVSIQTDLSQNELTFENKVLIELIIQEILVILTQKNDQIAKIIENDQKKSHKAIYESIAKVEKEIGTLLIGLNKFIKAIYVDGKLIDIPLIYANIIIKFPSLPVMLENFAFFYCQSFEITYEILNFAQIVIDNKLLKSIETHLKILNDLVIKEPELYGQILNNKDFFNQVRLDYNH